MPRTAICMLLLAVSAPAFAQVRIATTPRVRGFGFRTADPDRAVLGVSTRSDGKRDTLGVLVTSVTEGSPADKAGIEEGNRISSVNGVNLKLSRADAGESDMSGVMTNRLSREMRKLKPGDEATLEVWANGRYRTVRTRTVSAEDLIPVRHVRSNDDERAALGLSVSSNGSKRDTLGVFVSNVSEDGPADKAGIAEGDRVASINGVDLRTPREDVGDGWGSSNKVQRLHREIGKLKVGESADLVVISGGRSRSVKVTAIRARDLKDYRRRYSFRIGDGFGDMNFDDISDMNFEGMGNMHLNGGHDMNMNFDALHDMDFDALHDMNFDGLRESLRKIGPEVRMGLDRELPRAMDEVRRSLDRVRIEAPLLRARVMRRAII
ncbi:MAG TPA: PDZ domain-containing protein [Gemmatimonadaceae bacterium]|nr:PDZ domain-containing protein [Gemmatimonadaceae bacterium]